MSHAADKDFQQQMQRVEGLLEKIEQSADPALREVVREVVQCLLNLHGVGLATLLEHTARASAAGPALIDAFAADPLIASLLLLHDLHPLDEEARLRGPGQSSTLFALPQGRGGVAERFPRNRGLRLHGNSDSCALSAETMKRTIEEAIFAAAPEVTAVEVDKTPTDGLGVTGRFSLPLV